MGSDFFVSSQVSWCDQFLCEGSGHRHKKVPYYPIHMNDTKERKNKMSELTKKIHEDKNGLDYTLCGDYYLPDLDVEPG